MNNVVEENIVDKDAQVVDINNVMVREQVDVYVKKEMWQNKFLFLWKCLPKMTNTRFSTIMVFV